MSDLAEDPNVIAAAHGWSVVVPKGCELFIDVDDAASEEHLQAMLKVLADNEIPILETRRTVSPGGNTHVYLEIGVPRSGVLSPCERIALQAALGSDRKRELLSILRVMLDMDRAPTVFFETSPVEDSAPNVGDEQEIAF